MKTHRLFTIERLESRDTPSAMLLSSALNATSRNVEDPNRSRTVLLPAVQIQSAATACPSDPSATRAFNPQPDPPTMRAIIAILPQSGVVHGLDAAVQRGIIAI